MEKERAVLVTGASSGIGRHLTAYLSDRGHFVYAAARKDTDLEELAKLHNVQPVRLDVRQPEQIHAAYEMIASANRGLFGLINNAGLGGLGMFSTWTDDEMLEIFDVNVFGPHRMTNAFTPLLVAAKGRIVNISSQGGMITSKYYGPYTMTKHALEAYTDALHLELASYGVWVSVVQPGGIITDIGRNSLPGTVARFQRARPPFDTEAQNVLASFDQPVEPKDDEEESATNRKPSSPAIVSEAVSHALFSDQPKKRYLVGTKWEGDRVIHALIEKLLDENDNPRHNYTHDELVALIKQHQSSRETG